MARILGEIVLRSLDLHNWELVHTFFFEESSAMEQGWDYYYDDYERKGCLFINEKNNLFPIIPAIISQGFFIGNHSKKPNDHNYLENKDTSTQTFIKAFEFPTHSSTVAVKCNGHYKSFICQKSHLSSNINMPIQGRNWEDFWEEIEFTDDIAPWESSREYLSNSDRKKTRHLHSINKDPYSQIMIIGTGDLDSESHLLFSTDLLKKREETGVVQLHTIGTGSQKWRTVGVEFTPEFIYWAMDSQYSIQQIFRIKRSEIMNLGSSEIEENSVELVGTAADKSFLASISLNDEETHKIIFSTGYEVSKYNIDTLSRVFCVQENLDGSFVFSEIASFPTKANWFGKLLPVGCDEHGYIYFNTVCLNTIPDNQILKVRIT